MFTERKTYIFNFKHVKQRSKPVVLYGFRTKNVGCFENKMKSFFSHQITLRYTCWYHLNHELANNSKTEIKIENWFFSAFFENCYFSADVGKFISSINKLAKNVWILSHLNFKKRQKYTHYGFDDARKQWVSEFSVYPFILMVKVLLGDFVFHFLMECSLNTSVISFFFTYWFPGCGSLPGKIMTSLQTAIFHLEKIFADLIVSWNRSKPVQN